MNALATIRVGLAATLLATTSFGGTPQPRQRSTDVHRLESALNSLVSQRLGVTVDAQGRGHIVDKSNGNSDVNLWGVNYYPMGTLTSKLMDYAGMDTLASKKAEIDRDLDDLQFLRVNFIRIHVFDVEITDGAGNLQDNDQLNLLEYLLDQCSRRGITVMLTPVSWWWSPYSTSGAFSGWWHKNAFILGGMRPPGGLAKAGDTSGDDLWTRQDRYLAQLLSWQNRYSGVRIGHEPSVAMVEIMNEPSFWNYSELKFAAQNGFANDYLPNELKAREQDWDHYDANDIKLVWEDYQDHLAYAHFPEGLDSYCDYVYWRTKDYTSRMVDTIRQYSHQDMLVGSSLFGARFWGIIDPAVKAQETSIRNCHLHGVSDSSTDFVTHGFYPGFDERCSSLEVDGTCFTDDLNLLSETNFPESNDPPINSWRYRLKFDFDSGMRRKGRVVYEFGVAGNHNSAYALTAMAREMRQAGVQAAAFFQYDTRGSAYLNGIIPDWELGGDKPRAEVYNIHFMNRYHSPAQALDLLAGRKVFWAVPLWGSFAAPADDQWAWGSFVSYRGNAAVFSDAWSYVQTKPLEGVNNPAEWHDVSDVGDEVTCVGSCRYWDYHGTGMVRFKTTSANTGELTVCPDVTRLREWLANTDKNNARAPITRLEPSKKRRIVFRIEKGRTEKGLAGTTSTKRLTVPVTVPATECATQTVTW